MGKIPKRVWESCIRKWKEIQKWAATPEIRKLTWMKLEEEFGYRYWVGCAMCKHISLECEGCPLYGDWCRSWAMYSRISPQYRGYRDRRQWLATVKRFIEYMEKEKANVVG